jgi:quercetin dioxygenase-like cupin family protein
MPVIHAAATRRIQTPNAVMTTLASPTLGNAEHAVWRVEMRGGQAGPLHAIDTEQIMAVVAGGATVELGSDVLTAAAGDAIVLPADLPRRITAASDGLVAIVSARAGLQAYPLESVAGAFAAPVGERLTPPWAV